MSPKIKPVCRCDGCPHEENSMSCLEMIAYLHRFTLSSRKATLKRDFEVHIELEALREEIKQFREATMGWS